VLTKCLSDLEAMKIYNIRFSQYVRGRFGVFRGPKVLPNFCVGEVYRGNDGLFYFIPKADPAAADLYYGKTKMEAVNSFFQFF